MYKRTILAVFLMCATLFFVDYYYQKQHQEQLSGWKEQQIAKKEKLIDELEREIPKYTAESSQIPSVKISEAPSAEKIETAAVADGDFVVALAWKTKLPEKIFLLPADGGEKREAALVYDPEKIGQAAFYRLKEGSLLDTPSLSEFGSYDLQLISPSKKDPLNYKITWAQYQQGRLVIPERKLASLKFELSKLENEEKVFVEPLLSDSIVLMKKGERYLPVAQYEQQSSSLILFHDISALETLLQPLVQQTQGAQAHEKKLEEFFVLQTPYQQLVFSSWGGALVEINLPFDTTSKESVVKEIEFDREIEAQHPYDAHFPLHPYYTAGTSAGEKPYHKEGELGGYYPLLRRDLVEKKKEGKKIVRIPPRFYAFNTISEYPEVAEMVYSVKSFDSNSIVFEAVQAHRRITKTYTVSKAKENDAPVPYSFDLTIKIEGDSRGLWLTTGVPEVEWISGTASPALKYRMTRKQKSEVVALDLPAESLTMSTLSPDWICNSNGFFGIILDPLTEIDSGLYVQTIPGEIAPSRLLLIDEKYHLFDAAKLPGYQMMLPLKSAASNTMQFRVYAGPFATDTLKQVDALFSDEATGYNPDYVACQTFHGWFTFISEPFASFLFVLMRFFYFLTHSWAFSIILLTVALRLMLYPLNAWSIKATMRMQRIMPEVQKVQEKYKKDKMKAQQEVLNLYRENKVNPLSGCLPILIQIPFLMGMFDLLKSTFELRGAVFIPGWIDNLAAPDVVFSWGLPIPLLGTQFHALPLLLGLVMFIQQKIMSPLPKDPSQWTDQQRQQRSMGTIMAVVFAVMFYSVPSGLNIYWLSSMLLGILQQWWTSNRLKQAYARLPKK